MESRAAVIVALCEAWSDPILLGYRLPDPRETEVLTLIKPFFAATVVLFTGQGPEEVACPSAH